MKDIREHAERTLEREAEAPHPMACPTDAQCALARFALAVLDALDEANGASHITEVNVQDIRAAIARNMEKP